MWHFTCISGGACGGHVSLVRVQQVPDEAHHERNEAGRGVGILFWRPPQCLHPHPCDPAFHPAVCVPRHHWWVSLSLLLSLVLPLLFTFHFLEREIFFATLLGNSLWLLALSYYIYITFLGYSSLNMLTRFSWTKTNIYNNKYMYNLLLGPISS